MVEWSYELRSRWLGLSEGLIARHQAVGIQYSDVFGRLYRNIGNATFQDTGAFLPGTRLGFADAGDYDGDGLTDLLYHGRGTNLGDVVYLLRNSRR